MCGHRLYKQLSVTTPPGGEALHQTTMKTMPQLTPEELARNRAVFAAAVEARVGIPYSLYEELPAEGQRA
jgi:hypothetical protein